MEREEYMKLLGELNTYDRMKLNRLAAHFYEANGYIGDDIDFLMSPHPQEQLMFQLAVIANNFFKDEEGE